MVKSTKAKTFKQGRETWQKAYTPGAFFHGFTHEELFENELEALLLVQDAPLCQQLFSYSRAKLTITTEAAGAAMAVPTNEEVAKLCLSLDDAEIIHQDIIPQNLCRSSTGRLTLIDFAWASFPDSKLDHSKLPPGLCKGFSAPDNRGSLLLHL